MNLPSRLTAEQFKIARKYGIFEGVKLIPELEAMFWEEIGLCKWNLETATKNGICTKGHKFDKCERCKE